MSNPEYKVKFTGFCTSFNPKNGTYKEYRGETGIAQWLGFGEGTPDGIKAVFQITFEDGEVIRTNESNFKFIDMPKEVI